MRVVVQRVSSASCTVEGEITGQVGNGFLLLVGFCDTDTEAELEKMARKVVNLRIFDDGHGKMNKNIQDIQGSILSISQFTLYASCKKGNRPSFVKAAPGELAKPLYLRFNEILKETVPVEAGIFGADMKIALVNDGPVTILLDTEDL